MRAGCSAESGKKGSRKCHVQTWRAKISFWQLPNFPRNSRKIADTDKNMIRKRKEQPVVEVIKGS